MTENILGPEWQLSDEGINLITNNGTLKDKRAILENALNTDLRKIVKPISKLNTSSNDCVTQIVLQIDKIRNVSAPKINETSQAAPRLLKLDLVHDSKLTIQALELSSIPSINIEKTPPGTKLLINGAKFESSYLILNPSNCRLLGGKVPNLIEKWEMSKTARKQSSNKDGPPAWVNFGKKIQVSEIKPVKSIMVEEPKKENTEFDSQRQNAINSVANSGAIKKTFGGGVINVKDSPREPQINNHSKSESRSKPVKNFKTKEKDQEERLERRTDNISLFSYVEDKLPESSSKTYNQFKNNSASSDNNFKKQESSFKNSSSYNNDYKNYENKTSYTENYKDGKNNHYKTPNYSSNYKNYENKSAPTYTDNYKKNENYVKSTSNQRNSNHKNYTNEIQTNFPKINTNTASTTANPNVDNNLTNNFNKLSINNEFASRSLRQHLNLDKKSNDTSSNNQMKPNDWTVGQECMAKYWEDGKYYNAEITAITEKTYVVQFKGYGNTEEVLKTDCLPVKNKNYYSSTSSNNNTRKSYNQFSGTLEFRRGKSGNSYQDYK